jgi:hypothetical protein
MDGFEPRQCLLVMPAQLVSVKWPYQCRGRCTTNGRLYGWLTDWLTDCWLTDWLTDWLIDWLTDWLVGWLDSWLPKWLSGWLADWLAGRMSGWLTDWLAEWLSGWLADWLMCWFVHFSQLQVFLRCLNIPMKGSWKYRYKFDGSDWFPVRSDCIIPGETVRRLTELQNRSGWWST